MDNWFVALDGGIYKAAWGEISIISDEFLGIKTNRNSTNWFLQIGYGERSIVVAGCQVHYAIKSQKRPSDIGCLNDWVADSANGITIFKSPNRIWFTEE